MRKNIKKAVFPVAGMGTRFLPATKANPKEMLPVVDKPLIQYAAEEAVAAGIDTLIFVTGRNKRAIEDHFDTAYEMERELEIKGKIDRVSIDRLKAANIPTEVCYDSKQSPDSSTEESRDTEIRSETNEHDSTKPRRRGRPTRAEADEKRERERERDLDAKRRQEREQLDYDREFPPITTRAGRNSRPPDRL